MVDVQLLASGGKDLLLLLSLSLLLSSSLLVSLFSLYRRRLTAIQQHLIFHFLLYQSTILIYLYLIISF